MVDRKYKVPDIVSGYEVFEGLISFIRPSAYAENLIKNPKMWSTGGYSAVGDTDIVITHDEQYRGLFSLYCADSTGSYNGVGYEVAMTSGQKYKFGLDLKMEANQTIHLYLDTTGAITPDTASIITSVSSTGRWQRVNWEFNAPSTGDISVCVAVYSDYPFYTDGWMLIETEDFSGEPENYFDGDTPSFTLIDDFDWLGIRNASVSSRQSGVSASGREVFLSDLGFRINGIAGLGMNPISNIAIGINTGGGYYQNTIPNIRSLSIVGNIVSSSRVEFMGAHRKLVDLFKSDRTPNKQPILMRIYNYDNRESLITPILELRVVYNSGLEGQFVSDYGEIISLDFIEYDQFILEEKHNAVEVYQVATNASGIVSLSYSGEIDNMNGGPVPRSDTVSVYGIAVSQEGDVYVAGDMPSRNNIAKYNGSTWEDVSTGMTNIGRVVIEHKGYMIFAGDAGEIQIYDKENDALSTPTVSPNGKVNDLLSFGDYIVVAGEFTTPYNYLAFYDFDGDSWTNLSISAPDSYVRCLALSKDETKIFLGGDFESIGTDNCKYVAFIDTDGFDVNEMGGGIGSLGLYTEDMEGIITEDLEAICAEDYESSIYVSDIIEANDGSVYACGAFAMAGTNFSEARFVARYSWQEQDWIPLDGQNSWNDYSGYVSDLSSMTTTKDGEIFMAGHSDTSIARSLIFKHVHQGFICPIHIKVSGLSAPIGYACLAPAPDGGVYIGKG